jgi:hypothetical protein
MFIYLIVNHVTGKYYVGQHKGNNIKKYLQTKMSSARYRHRGNSHLFNSMRKYPQSTLWSIHALRSDIQTREELDETEKDFIRFLRSQNPEYGYNICRGGEGRTGPHSEISRKKTSNSIKKAWMIPEIRERLISNRRGKTHNRGCLIPYEARIRGGKIGGSIKSDVKIQHCKNIAHLGGIIGGLATNATTNGRKSRGGRASVLKMTTETRILAGTNGGKVTASKPGFLIEIGRIARCKHWQIGRGKPCICGHHNSL